MPTTALAANAVSAVYIKKRLHNSDRPAATAQCQCRCRHASRSFAVLRHASSPLWRRRWLPGVCSSGPPIYQSTMAAAVPSLLAPSWRLRSRLLPGKPGWLLCCRGGLSQPPSNPSTAWQSVCCKQRSVRTNSAAGWLILGGCPQEARFQSA